MSRLVLRGATVIDADGTRPRTTVVVDERRITAVRPDARDAGESGSRQATEGAEVDAPRDGDRVVDLAGRTLMPAMVSSHFHATYHELGSKPAPFGLEEPPALQAVRAAHHLELLLRCGFTGAVSAGAPFAIDASMKAAIAEGLFPGPRLMAGSRDVSTTGHAGDKSFAWYWDVGARGAINRSDGPAEFRRAVREEVKEGAEIIKMFVTGGHGTVAPAEQTEMTREEITAGIEAAHRARRPGARPHRQPRGAPHGARRRNRRRRPRGRPGRGRDRADGRSRYVPRAEPALPGPLRRVDGRGRGRARVHRVHDGGDGEGARRPACRQRRGRQAARRRRLWGDRASARPLRRRARVLREGGGHRAARRPPLGHPQRLRAHGEGTRARVRA